MGSERARDTVKRLQADITSGRWPINGRIPTEAELAAEFGVGRSTIREAVRSLAHLGMLEPAPGRGTFVRSLNPVRGVLSDFASTHSWRDILDVRRALEVQAADLAAQRRTPEGLAKLRAAHDADVSGDKATERGRTPGQFHALLVDLSGNALLADLYASLMSALREGMRRGALDNLQPAVERQEEHGALLAAIESGNSTLAAGLAASHACHDLRVLD
ncbi:FadR/GntR family transcriptional regulator [Nocardioides alcanivorans]|uniref:FadR/GntR family transcriptional regulator n=1 Tax=Nocardioides alcanivorans TaxID=2897352 RepID=UPI001F17B918|nr:FCD domain-containing protein [Nocardioides alcanivorans]